MHVATYVEQIGRELSAASVKQRLAVRMLFDWLVVGQVVPHNPASAMRGPKHSAAKGKMRMPTRNEAKALLASIPTNGLVSLRDRHAGRRLLPVGKQVVRPGRTACPIRTEVGLH